MSDPKASNVMFQGRRRKEPQTIITTAYIPRVKPAMMYPDDARSASSKVTHHHGLRAWEQMVGDSWQETDRPIALRRTDLDNKELKFKDRVFKRQRAARDTLPQALWHDLVTAPLLRTIHMKRLIQTYKSKIERVT